MSYVGWAPGCAICRKSVNLTVSKTDEYGFAVHENCYVSKLLSKKTTTSLSEEASPSRKSAARAGAGATRRSYPAGPLLG
jgi:hypothetical protein